jgi:hypothetical protein
MNASEVEVDVVRGVGQTELPNACEAVTVARGEQLGVAPGDQLDRRARLAPGAARDDDDARLDPVTHHTLEERDVLEEVLGRHRRWRWGSSRPSSFMACLIGRAEPPSSIF